MALKITLIVAFCVAQAFAVPTKGPCKHPISESAEEIPHEFEETLNEMDEIRETVSMAAMDAYFNGHDPQVILACFREQKGNYMKLGRQIAGMIRKASREMAQELGEKFEKYRKRAEAPIRNIAITMKELPHKMWEFIKDQEFSKAMEVMREARRTIEANSKELSKIIEDMALEAPETAEKAREMAREIRETARKGCKAIGDAFRQCVEEGGPKKPIEEDVEPEVDEEESEE